jgi:EmrB/QacA subfamily drug resistance transporter
VTPASADPRRWWSLFGLCLAAAIVWFAAANLPVAVPAISSDLGGSMTTLQWANTIFTLVTGALVIATGRLGDVLGRRLVLSSGLVIFLAASVLCALAPSTTILIAGRALMGVGAAAILPATLAIIPIEFSGKEEVIAFSVWMAVAGAGQALAPAIAGGLTQAFSWRALFWIDVPLCAAALGLVLFATPESRDESADRSIDFVGLVTVVGGLVALMYALNEGPSRGWGSPVIVGSLALAVALIAGCLLVERRVHNPLIDLELFRRRAFDGAIIDNFVYNLTLAGTMNALAIYLEEARGYDPFTTGLLLLPSTVALLVLIPVGGRLGLRRGPRFPLAAGTLIMGIGTFMLGFLSSDSPYAWMAVGLVIQGIGIGLFSTPLSETAVGLAPSDEAGAASGVFKMTSMVGGAFGIAILAAIYRSISFRSFDRSTASLGLTPQQNAILQDASGTSKGAAEVLAKFTAEVQHKLIAAGNDAFAAGVGGALKIALVFSLLALVAVLTLVPKGILHKDRQADEPGS